MNNRVNKKGVEGNLKGEGLLKGGLLIVSSIHGVVYQHGENTGYCMPYDDIMTVLNDLRPTSKPSV